MPAPKQAVKKAAPAKVVAKKPISAPKQVEKKIQDAERKIEEVKAKVKQEADFVKAEGKEISTGIAKRWNAASTEERVYTILGIILLLWGLFILRGMIWGLILIIVGLLFVTGYFLTKKGK